MTIRSYRKGDVLFRKGDLADEMFLIVKGKYLEQIPVEFTHNLHA